MIAFLSLRQTFKCKVHLRAAYNSQFFLNVRIIGCLCSNSGTNSAIFIKITFLNQLYYFINETIDKHLFNFINFYFSLFDRYIQNISFIETQYKLRRLLQSF